MADRPNVLWFFSEDFPPMTGAYGDALARTPALDRLASEGVLFEQAFCTTPVCAPSRFSLLTGMYPCSCAPAEQMRAQARIPFATYPESMRRAGYYATNNAKTHYNAEVDPHAIWDECSDSAHWRNRPDGVPFLACFAPQATHESAVFREGVTTVLPEQVRVPAFLPDTPAMREDIACYYTAIEQLDARLAQLLDELREDDLLDDTIVIWSSDHGGVWPRTKRFCYDEGLRVPLVVRVPDRWAHLSPWQPGERVTVAVGQIDVPPTLLALAGADIPDHWQGRPLFGAGAVTPEGYAFGGRNRMDERYDLTRTVRDHRYRYIRNYAPHRPWGQHYAFPWQARGWQSFEREHLAGRLTPAQEAFWSAKPAEELYDTVTDPDQIHNLADVPEHADRVGTFRDLLDQHMLTVNDNGFLPEGHPLEGYHPSREPGAYPLPRIMELADLAIQRDPDHLEEFTTALRDDHDVVRFWAAQGLLMLQHDARPAAASLLRSLQDPSPHVRIAAAEAYTWTSDDPTPAIELLTDHLGPDRDWRTRLQAINALTNLPAPPTAALPAIEACGDDEQEYVRGAARYLRLLLLGEYAPDAQIFDWALFHAAEPGP